MAEKNIELDSVEVAAAVFGNCDRNIRLLENEFSVTAVCRGTQLRLAPGRPLRNAEIKGEGTMEQLFLMPGEERCERFKDGNGIPRVHYSYRSMHGAFFDCESRSLEEAQRLCEDWLVGQDRCYRN